MKTDQFYEAIYQAAEVSPGERYQLLAGLHRQVYQDYIGAVRLITPENAASQVMQGEDNRTLAQLVGHMMAWDRFTVLAATDILVGLDLPRSVTALEGYVAYDGEAMSFASVDEFNAYHAEKHATWPWPRLQQAALDMAATVHAMFTAPGMLDAGKLENTQPHRKRLHDPDRTVLEGLTAGWALWLMELEHIGAEHVRELGIF